VSDIAAIRAGLATTLAANVAGLSTANVFKYAPDSAPDSGVFGFFHMKEGDIAIPRFQLRETNHHIFFTLCFSLQSGLGDAEANADGFVQLVIAAVDLHKTLGGVANISEAAVDHYEVTEVKLRSDPTEPTMYGVRFRIWVSEIETGSLMSA
jgi:hypothetical protein